MIYFVGLLSAVTLELVTPVLPSTPTESVRVTTDPAPTVAKVLFVNFDGGTISPCPGSDPRGNCSELHAGVIDPFEGDFAMRAEIIAVMRERLAAYNFRITDTRPPGDVDYDMEMVGNWNGQVPSFGGIAPGWDCWDERGGEISFAIGGHLTTPQRGADVILQELAHSWGLDHVSDRSDLLYPTLTSDDKAFRDVCSPIVANSELRPTEGGCPELHEMACGSNDRQNSHAELLAVFGPGVPDEVAPTVTLPGVDEDLELSEAEGQAFELTVRMIDNEVPALLATTVRITPQSGDTQRVFVTLPTPAEHTFPLGLPKGLFELEVEAEDESGNVTLIHRRLAIGIPLPEGPGDGTGEGSAESTTSQDDTPSNAGEGCRITDPSAPGWIGLGPVWVFARRRRRQGWASGPTPAAVHRRGVRGPVTLRRNRGVSSSGYHSTERR